MAMEYTRGARISVICSGCGIIFNRPVNTIRNGQNKIYCKRGCGKQTSKEKAQKKKENYRIWKINNRNKHLETVKKWRQKNRDKIKEYKKHEYKKHKDNILARSKVYYEINKETFLLKNKEYYQRNKKKIAAREHKKRKENPEYFRKQAEKHRKNNRVSLLWSGAKKSARVANVKFDITKEWLQERLDIGKCEMSGLSFDMDGRRTPNSPSIDRIKAGGDYIMSNCRIILWSINHALSNYGDEYMLNVFECIFNKRNRLP